MELIETLRIKLILIGDGRIGKTSLVNRFCYDQFSETTDPTVGVNFHTAKFRMDSNSKPIDVTMTLWDMGGQDAYNSYIPVFSKAYDVAVFCFDMNSEESFHSLDKWIKLVGEQNENQQLRFLVGTKLDLLYRKPEKLATPTGELDVFLEKNNFSGYFITSSSYGINVVENFHNIAQVFKQETSKRHK